jgi:hypothetical protein
MPDIEGIIKITNLLLQRIFGKNVPAWISPLINWILLGVLLLCGLWGLLVLLSKIKEVWIQSFLPLFYKPEQKRRQHRRRMFAKHLEYEISRLDLLEDWKDEHFAELEAEVEADGRRKRFVLFPFNQPKSGLRREKSLSKALANSQERFILVEGEPGSGKSVALRHVAQHMAAQAKTSRSMKSVIPIYVNLKELERPDDGVIDRNLIESFILKSLKRINDRDVDTFLDDEFREGIINGTWFFLFDSFDELPEVLSSTEADVVIKSYSDAIADFLQGGMNQCRGVIASRQFRGPKHFRWPRFRILALSELRRRELVRKADLPLALERDLIGYIGTANQEIRSMTSNPLFLSLLCEHMKSGHSFPENTHAVFETYIEHRLNRDKERILQRFKVDVQQIRTAAENIAFCMIGNIGLGLSPTRANLHSAMTHQGLDEGASFDTLLDALEYIKLARSEVVTEVGDSRSFTFAHRRFQEYFATCVVLRDPTCVSPEQLLTDGRWRETAVVMCQTQPVQALAPLMHYAEQLLTHFCQNIPSLIDKPLAYLNSRNQDVSIQQVQVLQHFPWPAGALHLLALLQEGFTSRLDVLSDAIKLCVGKLGLSATETGALDDRKWALEVCGVAPEPILIYMLKKAFAEKSQWLKEVAYRQVARLHGIPEEIALGMREAIINLHLDGRLRRESYATRAYLARLPEPVSADLFSSMELLSHLYTIDFEWHILLFIIIIFCCFFYHMLCIKVCIFLLLTLMLIITSFTSTFFIDSLRIKAKYNESSCKFTTTIRILISMLFMFICLYLNFKPLISSQPINILFYLFIFSIDLIPSCSYEIVRKGYPTQWICWAFIPSWPCICIILFSCKTTLPYIRSLTFRKVLKAVISLFTPDMAYLVFIHQIIFTSLPLIIIIYSLRMLHEWQKWKKWSKSPKKTLTCHEFYTLINTFCYRSYHLRVIKYVRQSYLLVAVKKTEESLKKLALEVEIYLKNGRKANSECPILIEKADYEVLDEIYLLLKDVRSSLYGNTTSV